MYSLASGGSTNAPFFIHSLSEQEIHLKQSPLVVKGDSSTSPHTRSNLRFSVLLKDIWRGRAGIKPAQTSKGLTKDDIKLHYGNCRIQGFWNFIHSAGQKVGICWILWTSFPQVMFLSYFTFWSRPKLKLTVLRHIR